MSLPFRWLSPQRTSCSCYSEIQERSGFMKHVNYCACEPEQPENLSSGGSAAADACCSPWWQLLHATSGLYICLVPLIIKGSPEPSHLFPHETLPFIGALQLLSVLALRPDYTAAERRPRSCHVIGRVTSDGDLFPRQDVHAAARRKVLAFFPPPPGGETRQLSGDKPNSAIKTASFQLNEK